MLNGALPEKCVQVASDCFARTGCMNRLQLHHYQCSDVGSTLIIHAALVLMCVVIYTYMCIALSICDNHSIVCVYVCV